MDTVVGNNNLIVHQLLERQAVKFPVLVTLFKRANNLVIASFRSRNGEAIKVAEKLQGGGHANASGALLPKSVRNTNRSRGISALDFESEARRALEQSGKLVCRD